MKDVKIINNNMVKKKTFGDYIVDGFFILLVVGFAVSLMTNFVIGMATLIKLVIR